MIDITEFHGIAENPPDVILVGGSVRAAAFSLRRAGLRPLCFDRFADRDLLAAAQAHRIAELSQSIVDELRPWAGVPVAYAGAMENHPEIVAALADRHPIWGNSADVLVRTRDPQILRSTLDALRLPTLAVRSADDRPPADGTWLLKPSDGSGGHGIVFWNEAALDHPTLRRPHYFQEFAPGTPCSAVFMAGECVGDVRFVGITRQLVGVSALGGSDFAWCGNVGPVDLSIPTEHAVRRLGNMLKWKLELRGLFGIDFVVGESGVPKLVEVNPRWTASVELLEWLLGESLLGEHCRLFAPGLLDGPARFTPVDSRCVGKAVVYATQTTISPAFDEPSAAPWASWPTVADIPAEQAVTSAGTPICTVYAGGEDLTECQERLLDAADRIRHR